MDANTFQHMSQQADEVVWGYPRAGVADLESSAHVSAAHSWASTPRKRKYYNIFTTQSSQYWDIRKVRMKTTPTQTQTGPPLLPWQNIKENISQILPLVCKWDQEGLGALVSIWGLVNRKFPAAAESQWRPTCAVHSRGNFECHFLS